jgi:glutamyl-Q tRNA(Asp) synthetase
MFEALEFLGQHPPTELKNVNLGEIWHWAIANWQLKNVPKLQQIVRL